MQIAFGRVRRKTSPARECVRDCYSLKCQHIFGLYYNFDLPVDVLCCRAIQFSVFGFRFYEKSRDREVAPTAKSLSAENRN